MKQWPATIDEAVGVVIASLSEEEKAAIAAMAESELIGLHFGLGMWIRNNLGLWQGNDELMQAIRERDQAIHPDDAFFCDHRSGVAAAAGRRSEGAWRCSATGHNRPISLASKLASEGLLYPRSCRTASGSNSGSVAVESPPVSVHNAAVSSRLMSREKGWLARRSASLRDERELSPFAVASPLPQGVH